MFPIKNEFNNKYELNVIEYKPKEIKNSEGKIVGYVEFSYNDNWTFILDIQESIGDKLFEIMLLSNNSYYSHHDGVLCLNINNEAIVAINRQNNNTIFNIISLPDKVIRLTKEKNNNVNVLPLTPNEIKKYYKYFVKYTLSCKDFIEYAQKIDL